MVVIRNGRFISRKKTSSDEVHQMRSSGSYGYELKYDKKRIWPSFNVNCLENTLSFHWDTKDGLGGIQGNKPIPDNSSSDKIHEFDPNGGNGYINLIDRETSLWHRPELQILVIGPNDGNDIKIGSIDSIKLPGNIDSAGTIEASTDFSDNDIEKVKSDNDIDKVKKLYAEEFKDVSTDNIVINKYRIKPNQPDEFYDGNGNYTDDYKYTPCYKSTEDFWTHFTINPNNSTNNRYGMIIISKIYTKIGETINLLEIGNSVKLASWYQKPNILYYCHANWVDVDGNAITNDNCEYNELNAGVYLHIELGISPDGGNTIFWNDSHKNSTKYQAIKNLSASVPDVLTTNAITVEISGTDRNRFLSNYGVQIANGNSADKILRILLYPKYVNNEDNNTNYEIEKYYVGYTSDDYNNSANPNNKKHDSDIVGINGKNWAQSGYMAQSESNVDTPSNTEFCDVSTTFRIKRMRSTSPWNINLKVKVNINKDTCPGYMTQERYTTEKKN
jgi:hypothetical protein